MEREQIIKALECCAKDDCDNCPNDFGNCYANLAGYALSLINELTEENERLIANNLTFAHGVEKVAANYYNRGCTDTVHKFAESLEKPLGAYINASNCETLEALVWCLELIEQKKKEMLEGNDGI